MIPSATTTLIAPKQSFATAPQTANKTSAPPAPDTGRGSAGETAAGNVTAETAVAVDASEQAAVAPRLRDQETAEQSDRQPLDKDRPTGPPPAFEESPLERQARVALEPPVIPDESGTTDPSELAIPVDQPSSTGMEPENEPMEPPPTRTEKAEASFAETKTISEPRESSSLDLRN